MVTNVRIVRYETDQEKAIRIIFAPLMCLGLLGLGLYKLFDYIGDWEKFDAPYNYISAFYHYSFSIPLSTFGDISEWLTHLNMTPYPNLNIVLSGFTIFIYGSFFIFVYLLVFKLMYRIRLHPSIIFIPALFALIWFLGAGLFGWLFSTS